MPSSDEVTIETAITREAAIERLKALLADDQRRAGNNYMPSSGEVSEQKVVLHWRRGLFRWRGTFHGRFDEGARGVRLVGSYSRSIGFIPVWSAFLLLWAVVVVLATLTRWEGPKSIGWLAPAVIAVVVGVFAMWLRKKNSSAELAVFRSELDSIFGRHGA